MPEPLDLPRTDTAEFLQNSRAINPLPQSGIEFLDQDWADEFDRRLAAWQSLSSDEPFPAGASAPEWREGDCQK